MQTSVCKICDHKTELDFSLYDDRYGYPDNFKIVKCPNCKHKYTLNNFVEKDIEDLYTKFYPRSKYDEADLRVKKTEGNSIIDFWNGAYSNSFKWVPRNVKVLDIGCGFGLSLRYHQSRGCEAYGVEADHNVEEVAKSLNLNVKIGAFNHNNYQSEYFDFITLDQVLEHLINPQETINGIYKILKPNGKIIVSIPNPNGIGARLFKEKWVHWHIPYHLQHYSKKSIEILSNKSGLKIDKITTITNSRWLDFQWRHLLYYPDFSKKSKFWLNEQSMDDRLSKKISIFFIRIMRFVGINHFITRFFDFLNLGDNYLIVLSKNDKKPSFD